MRHTIVISVPEKPRTGRRQLTNDEIAGRLTAHIERWGGWPGIEVVEYHQEQMTTPAEELGPDFM